ncbi:MAG: PLP-dependent cysteine synthase family protein [Planctomycetes bacterium]|nr:PLP-dependent cysteine synthase family protein [Planctomycetota bacterium]
MVGKTPLLDLRCRLDGRDLRIFAKLETLNPTGSVKDRMALHILETARDSGALLPGAPIAEATSGNTGLSFASLGRALGHPVRIYMPDWMSRERADLIRAYGAEIIPVSKAQGGFLGSIALAEAWSKEHPECFLPRQFENVANVEAHRLTTGREILAQLATLGLAPTAFVAGVGTGGTVMGVGACLRHAIPSVKIHPLEPANSPTLRTGHCVGHHRIQGISDEFIPAIVNLAALDAIVDVHDGDAILAAQSLSRDLGLGLGISSGANLIGSLKVARALGPGSVVVTVFPDSNKKYLSTDLFRCEEVREGYLSPGLELQGFEAVPGAAAHV